MIGINTQSDFEYSRNRIPASRSRCISITKLLSTLRMSTLHSMGTQLRRIELLPCWLSPGIYTMSVEFLKIDRSINEAIETEITLSPS